MQKNLGIALGGGGARGWAHIGVLDALDEMGLIPGVVAGASIGSLVGAAHASRQMDTLRDWALSLTRIDVFRLLDANFRGGVISGDRIMGAVSSELTDALIDEMGLSFAAVATDLDTGREVWLQEGSMLGAVRASCGLPGLFAPYRHNGRWLIDGGVVNPVPVSLCHAMGAETVIAVNLNSPREIYRRRARRLTPEATSVQEQGYLDKLSRFLNWNRKHDESREPRLFDVINATVNIMQERITRSRLAGDPPHVELWPDVHDIQIMDFHLAKKAIARGREAVERSARELGELAQMI